MGYAYYLCLIKAFEKEVKQRIISTKNYDEQSQSKAYSKKKKLIHYQQLTIFSPTWHKEASNSYDHKNHYFSPLKSREKHKKSARFHNILSLKAILAWSLNYLTKQQKIEIFWSNEKETILTERKTMLQQLFKVM